MNIKKLSALLVLMSVFVFSAAMPAFARSNSFEHPPQCKTSQALSKIIIECTDVGEDIIKADIIKSNQVLNYTAELSDHRAVITVYPSLTNRKPSFTWLVADAQGNEVTGSFPSIIVDEG